jgi:two-component system, cell cycle response regulator
MTRVSTVLVADPSANARAETQRALQAAGYRVVGCPLGEELLRVLDQERPQIVVLEPVPEGWEPLRQIKKTFSRDGDFCPVLVLSSRADAGARAEALDAGAEDAVGKPCDPRELVARVAALLRTRRIVDEALRSRSDLEESATHDPLTGLYNQRYLTTRLDEEFRRAQRYQEPLSLLKVDLDGFEQVNGRFGRGVGDRLLAACARAIVGTCREVDIVTRAGGDEFVVLLPNTHFSGSMAIAERLWNELRRATVDAGTGAAHCEASLGVACFPGREVGKPTDLLRFADGALRRAKAEGRGRIVLYQHQGYLLEPERSAEH